MTVGLGFSEPRKHSVVSMMLSRGQDIQAEKHMQQEKMVKQLRMNFFRPFDKMDYFKKTELLDS